MRIVKLKELIEMEPGTIFSQWEPAHSRGLYSLYAKFLNNDYQYISLLPEPEDCNEGKLDPVLLADTVFRYGMYDEEKTFAVYEDQDLIRLNGFIKKALEALVVPFFFMPIAKLPPGPAYENFSQRIIEIMGAPSHGKTKLAEQGDQDTTQTLSE